MSKCGILNIYIYDFSFGDEQLAGNKEKISL